MVASSIQCSLNVSADHLKRDFTPITVSDEQPSLFDKARASAAHRGARGMKASVASSATTAEPT